MIRRAFLAPAQAIAAQAQGVFPRDDFRSGARAIAEPLNEATGAISAALRQP